MELKENTKNSFEERLQQLAQLNSGWLDGYGQKVDPKSIKQALLFSSKLEEKQADKLSLFPLRSGGIVIERQIDRHRWSLTINTAIDQEISVLTLIDNQFRELSSTTISEAATDYTSFLKSLEIKK